MDDALPAPRPALVYLLRLAALPPPGPATARSAEVNHVHRLYPEAY